jgi:7-cyano-7-deazaguanine synthase
MAKAVHHHQIPINSFSFVTQSALLHDNKQNWPIDAPHPNNVNLPASFVPGRNLIFLTLAAALAYKFEIRDLYTGVCETDYSGYPDCRLNTIDALQLAISRGMDVPFTIHTPLMFDTKAETVLRMKDLGRLDWYKETHTCYEGVRPGCRVCPSCILRQKGFDEAGIKDPLFE